MRTTLRPACAALALLLAGNALAQQTDLAQQTYLAQQTDLAQQTGLESLRQQVADTERAFAQTMADRDHAAFTAFLADEAVFFDAATPLVGKDAVAAAWAAFFDAPEPPFSWQPETVVVLASGTLAHSSGPVRTPDGQRVATFNSVWRREPSGDWKIVFDKGSRDCPQPPETAGG
jgi:ketosteroid isomerase-like protein